MRRSTLLYVLAGLVILAVLVPAFAVGTQPPENVSLSPNSGAIHADSKATLTARYADPDGYKDIAYCRLLINTTLDPKRAVYVVYDAVRNRLYIRNDKDTSWLGGSAPGTNRTIASGFGRLYIGDTRVNRSGNDMTVVWVLDVKSPFKGKTVNAWMYVSDREGHRQGWQKMGTFDVK